VVFPFNDREAVRTPLRRTLLGSDPRPLVEQEGIDEYPVWSSDGVWLAFNCSLGTVLPSGVGDFEICVVKAEGTQLRRVTDAPGITGAGAWTPDGRQIVSSSSRDQDPGGVSQCGDLFAVAADGSSASQLTEGPATDCDPTISPDGRYVIFASSSTRRGGDSDLFAMAVDGSNVTRLTRFPSEEQEPAFLANQD
jgi:Tol biopolymer transport system component